MNKKIFILAILTMILLTGCSTEKEKNDLPKKETISCTKELDNLTKNEKKTINITFIDEKMTDFEMKGISTIKQENYKEITPTYNEYVNKLADDFKNSLAKNTDPEFKYNVEVTDTKSIKYSISININAAKEETYAYYFKGPNITKTSKKEEVKNGYKSQGFTCK